MNAEIIQFIPRRDRGREQADFPVIASYPGIAVDVASARDADTAPCEYTEPESNGST